MIFRLLKSNQPFILFFLPAIAILIWIYGFMRPINALELNQMPLYKMIADSFINSTIISTILGLLFLIGESFLIIYIVNENELTPKRTYLPGFIYVIISSSSADALLLHPVLISNLFLLLAVNKLLHIYRKEDTFSEIFDAGFLVSIATLFYFPSIMLFAIIFVGLILFHPFIWREWVISMIGFILPLIFLISYYYLTDESIKSVFNNAFNSLQDKNYVIPYNKATLAFAGFVIVLLSFSLFFFFTRSGGIKLKSQKSIAFNNWFLLIAMVAFIILSKWSATDMTLLAIPVSIIFTNYLMAIKRGWLAELLFLIFVAVSLISLYNTP